MPSDVTIGPVGTDGTYPVSIPFAKAAQASAAQIAINSINDSLAVGTIALDIVTGARVPPTSGTIALAVQGSGNYAVSPPANTALIAVTAPNVTVSGAASGAAQVAIISGGGDVFINRDQAVNAFVSDSAASTPNTIINDVGFDEFLLRSTQTFDVSGVNLITSSGIPSFDMIDIVAEPDSTSFIGTGFIGFQAFSGAVTVVGNHNGPLPNGLSSATIAGGGADLTYFGNGGNSTINQGSGHATIFGGSGGRSS